VRIMESDPEQTPYRDELFTALPEIATGHMKIPTAPGWGTELNEKAAKKYEWSG
jgi:galactonate dehydratase